MKQLVQLTKSMDSTVRSNALWALKNLVFLAEKVCKEGIFLELTASSLASLVSGNDNILFVTINTPYKKFLTMMVL